MNNSTFQPVSLREIGYFYGGLTGKSGKDFGRGNSKYITFMNVIKNVIAESDLTEFVEIKDGERQNKVSKGDLLFNGSSETPEEVAFPSLVTSDLEGLYLNSFCFGFRFEKLDIIDPLFFAYYLRSNYGRQFMSQLAQGSTRYNISKRALLDVEWRLPNVKEQKAIAEALSDIDELITVVKANIVKIQNVKQGLIHQIFSNLARSEKLKDYAFLASGGTPLTSVKSYYGGEIAWASISDMTHSGKYIESTERKLTESGLKNSAAHIYPDNTLLFAMYASIGKCAIPTVPIASSQAILGITCKSGLLCNFLYHFLTFIQPELIASGQQGTQSNLNKIIVGDILIPLLSEDEQKNIAAKLDLFDEILDSDKKELSKLERLKRAMMHDLLSGKVRLV